MLVAGVAMEEQDLPKLIALGVKDSKMLTAKRRETLAEEIKNKAKAYSTLRLMPCEIDPAVDNIRKLHKLNRLEAQTMAKMIEKLHPDKVYVDAADVVETRFKHHILECLSFRPIIIAEHKADRNYAIVSAASIVAKVQRDTEIAELRDKYGDFGSGYSSDPKTKRFLKTLIAKNEEYPEFVRKSWKPAKKAKSEKGTTQKKLM